MTNLKEINFGLNTFCGPAVLSALTGESTDRCAAVISAVSGKTEIKAVQPEHLKEALKWLRFSVAETNFEGSTLYGTLYRMQEYNGLYIVFVPQHVVAIEIKDNEMYICDNHCKTPLDIKSSARLTQKVSSVWRIIPRDPPKFIGSSIRLDRSYNKIEIVSVNRYEKSEDDNQHILGYIKYKDINELKNIIRTLKSDTEFGDWE